MKISQSFALGAALLAASSGFPARAVTVEQIISRENPAFHARDASLAVGRDGMVYIGSGGNDSFVLRMKPDGTDKIGAPTVYAMANISANADGVMASANGHFAHKVAIYDKSFKQMTELTDFLVNDTVGWDAPAHMEAGESGDFYGVDQHRDRILRISPAAKLVRAFKIPRSPEGGGGLIQDFRVSEAQQALYIVTRQGPVRCFGFDGNLRWTANIGVGWDSGGFDVDKNGVVYAIERLSDTIRKFGPEGKPAGDIKLQLGERKPQPGEHGFIALRLSGDDVLLKRKHEIELFQRYALADGAFRNAESIAYERLSMNYGKEVWTAGENVSFRLNFSPGAQNVTPRWRVWARPLGTLGYREFKLQDGQLAIPADAGGIYQIKVTPEVEPWLRGLSSEYLVRSWVEIRQPGSRGSVNVLTPNNRVYYRRGETLPFSLIVRAADAARVTATVRLAEANAGGRVLVEGSATTGAGQVLQYNLAPALTAGLAPGNYTITATAAGLTSAAQSITIGPADGPAAFSIVEHGDYGATYPTANVWDTPDVALKHVQRTFKLGFNLLADRIGSPLQIGDLAPARVQGEVGDLAKRLQGDPIAIAPEKVQVLPTLPQVMAGYGAYGIDEMPILLMMDAGLPLGGPGFDNRKPEQLAKDINTVNSGLLPYPSYRGWSWNSNWWIYDQRGANAAATPEDKKAYEAAYKKAMDTGAWDPILDKVSERRLGYAVEAQDLFNKTLRAAAPNRKLVSASAGTYRNVESYPPISFSNIEEVDLQGQFEQVHLPYFPMHSVDFMRRPGKRVWGHPEVWNDDGTGGQIVPNLMAMFMRGTDGAGMSGHVPMWVGDGDDLPFDPRIGHYGQPSVYRALNSVFQQYGPWLTTTQNNDQVAIVVSGRMFKIDNWATVTGLHFARAMEAYVSCMHAHHPASYIFAEDVKPDTLRRYRAVLIVGQKVEMEPALLTAVQNAKAAGSTILYDGTCREQLMAGFTPLGISFDKFEKDKHPASDDAAFVRFPQYVLANVPALKKALDPIARQPALVDNPEVLLSQRTAGAGRYIFVVNNTTPELNPGQMWRMNLTITSRVPLVAPVRLPALRPGEALYDMLALKQVTPQNGAVQADLRDFPARIYAVLPAAISQVALLGPSSAAAGQSFKWWAQVRDAAGKPIAAGVPIRVRLLAPTGAVLEEHYLAAGEPGASGNMTIPVNAAANYTVEVTELCSGKSARLIVGASPARLPLGLAATGGTITLASATMPPSRSSGKAAPTALTPAADMFGPHVRDMVLTADGDTAVMNTMNWDHNLYAVDVNSGQVKWRQRVGDYFAFAPQAVTGGIAAQGFDFQAAEGYNTYLLDKTGAPQRSFALYGLPRRLPHRFVPGLLRDFTNHFAVPRDGSWVASAGDLGLAVWNLEGKLLWSQEWWKTKRHTATLGAPDAATLIAVEGMTGTGYDAATGTARWQLELARTGEVKEIVASTDGKTVALLATTEGGRIFVLRDGKLVRAFPSPANQVAVAADGSFVAAVTNNQLRFYSVENGLQWVYSGDDMLRFPRLAPDGQRIAVTSDIGTAYVLDLSGTVLWQKDCGALAVPAWLPDNGLILATWMGRVTRLDSNYKEKWNTLLRATATDMRGKLVTTETMPQTRMGGWGNAAAEAAPIAPNLLTDTKALVRFVAEGIPHVQFARASAPMTDGNPKAPDEPWLNWPDVGGFAESAPTTYITLDTFRTQLRVKGITFFEDAAHPESWLRDASLDYWDATKEAWVPVQPLLADAAVHTHWLAKPVEASRLRIVLPKGMYGNIRLGEIVLHGEQLGAAHPAVIGKLPTAVLFDESNEFKDIYPYADRWDMKFDGAYSGGRFLQVNADQNIAPAFIPPFGHMVPNWDFEIAENPQPGQYRWIQFAYKALAPATRGASIFLSGEGGNLTLHAGEIYPNLLGTPVKAADGIGTEWRTAKIDLWQVAKRPLRIRSAYFGAVGGAVGFDQIVLGRTEADLPAK